jgi:hypothetical protein
VSAPVLNPGDTGRVTGPGFDVPGIVEEVVPFSMLVRYNPGDGETAHWFRTAPAAHWGKMHGRVQVRFRLAGTPT